ncbi:MAG TPA: CAP domain-containing protein [Candidatus Dormibacteraeota bacterium]|nr:CAP domain-containing protein [Candidatus Dormibacteraeota bacterium]
MTSPADHNWDLLQSTARLVRAAGSSSDDRVPATGRARARRAPLIVGAAVAGAAFAALASAHTAAPALADATADQDLFSLTNQDRASNGLPAVQWHSVLGAIGENKPYGGCGFTVNGRSLDMIQRNYFAHPILNCGGQYVFSMLTASGINYRAAGENIGWASGAGDTASTASYINQEFMNSPEHRSNILHASFTHLGVGSYLSPPGVTWTGGGSGQQNVWMFSEEFAQLSSAPPPPPPATQRPAPPPAPTGGTAAKSSTPAPPPATTAPTPAATVIPTPTPSPTPVPTETPTPAPNLGAPQPPLVWSGGGLIADSIEGVLEAFLVD